MRNYLSNGLGLPRGCLHSDMCQGIDQLGTLSAGKTAELRDRMRACYRGWTDKAMSRGDIKTQSSPPIAALYIEAKSITRWHNKGLAIRQRIFKRFQSCFRYVRLDPFSIDHRNVDRCCEQQR